MKTIGKLVIIISIIILLSSCYHENLKVEITNKSGTDIKNNTGKDVKIQINNYKSGTTQNEIGYNGIDNTNLGLKVSDNLTISIFADGLSGARDIEGPDAKGNIIISRTKEGIITLLEKSNSGTVIKMDILKGLNNPHGLALSKDGLTLYYAETNKISKIRLYSDSTPEKIIDLPNGGRHFTRSLIFGNDGKLYVSIGSTCDTCFEKDERTASIYRLNTNGSNFEKVASGLRNSVFMALNPNNGYIWATEMGRDNLGDNQPTDEINIIKFGNDYGWPICYGKNVHDSVFDKNKYITNPCNNKIPAHIELQAHSAPLGIAFAPKEGGPEYYKNSLFIAYHGSWNRSIPTGYKIVKIKLDDKGNAIEQRDFITGFINKKNNVLGRPVDILTQTGGIAYVTDDMKGVIYKISYNN